ncbi:aminotransferase class V-fold PLP-dependent enzyme [Acerihabitans sp. KWT182]|uniref:Phosphoserine aminotransferase n=1 Tax=Acerihabitans sp. KWT182 TaxID=3157919 RepID=A0AAU7QDN1_9GAMM
MLIRDGVVQAAPQNLPAFLDYRRQVEAHSNFNTPPVFAIYVVLLVTRWLLHEIGGVENMARINRDKAELLYGILDGSNEFYRGWGYARDRSSMNVTFNLPNAELERTFFTEAKAAGFSGLEGHRAIGGVRASIYNALAMSSVEKLADFMQDFQRRNERHASSHA